MRTFLEGPAADRVCPQGGLGGDPADRETPEALVRWRPPAYGW
ncbi:hypothetical protein ABZ023_03125 [Streptomyces sp. NPDC006367]